MDSALAASTIPLMEISPEETRALRALVHDINGQIFLIRGHTEIARRNDQNTQLNANLHQIQLSTDELERLVRELREQLGFPVEKK